MKTSTTLLASALLASTSLVQAAELSGNIAAQSNYLFRGVSQTDDSAAVSGGLDLNFDNSFYLGTWMSNIDFGNDDQGKAVDGGVEVDLYAGFGGDFGNMSYDLAALYYWYPGDGSNDLDYAEVSGSLGWSWLTGNLSYTVYSEASGAHAFNEGDYYASLGVDFPWEYQGFTMSAMIGTYQFTDDGDCADCDFNYTNWGITVAKDVGDFGSLSVNYEQTDEENDVSITDDPQFWIGWSKGF